MWQCPGCGEGLRRRQAHAGAGAGDKGDLAPEIIADRPGEPVRRPFDGGLTAGALDVHRAAPAVPNLDRQVGDALAGD